MLFISKRYNKPFFIAVIVLLFIVIIFKLFSYKDEVKAKEARIALLIDSIVTLDTRIDEMTSDSIKFVAKIRGLEYDLQEERRLANIRISKLQGEIESITNRLSFFRRKSNDLTDQLSKQKKLIKDKGKENDNLVAMIKEISQELDEKDKPAENINGIKQNLSNNLAAVLGNLYLPVFAENYQKIKKHLAPVSVYEIDQIYSSPEYRYFRKRCRRLKLLSFEDVYRLLMEKGLNPKTTSERTIKNILIDIMHSSFIKWGEFLDLSDLERIKSIFEEHLNK